MRAKQSECGNKAKFDKLLKNVAVVSNPHLSLSLVDVIGPSPQTGEGVTVRLPFE